MAFRLIPKEEKFFEDFVSMAEQIHRGSLLLEQMLAPEQPLWDKADEIKEVHPQVAASPKKTAAQAAQPASRPGTRVKRKPDASASARATRPRDPSRTASATRGK